MARITKTILGLATLLTFAAAASPVKAAEDEIAQRLHVVARMDCQANWTNYGASRAVCATLKAAALDAYGKRIIMKQSCMIQTPMTAISACQEQAREYDALVLEAIFGEKASAAKR